LRQLRKKPGIGAVIPGKSLNPSGLSRLDNPELPVVFILKDRLGFENRVGIPFVNTLSEISESLMAVYL
jgi:hypothetical protein